MERLQTVQSDPGFGPLNSINEIGLQSKFLRKNLNYHTAFRIIGGLKYNPSGLMQH